MNVKLLIDAITHQTMILIAQLSTAAGLRAPLAHVANQVFLDLVEELEAQGVGRKVIADMFGLALRSYQLKVQRLSESTTEQNRSLWEAVYAFVQSRSAITRADVLFHFRLDDDAVIKSILHDQVESGLVFRSGRGHSTVYRAASEEELGISTSSAAGRIAASIAWVAVYRNSPTTLEDLTRILNTDPTSLPPVLDELVDEGRIAREAREDGTTIYHCRTMILPIGEPAGWEGAVFDHYQAVVAALCAKLRRGDTQSLSADIIGGSTWSFDVWKGHPFEDRVRNLLRDVRGQISALRREVTAYNESQGRPLRGAARVIFYAGQNIVLDHEDEDLP